MRLVVDASVLIDNVRGVAGAKSLMVTAFARGDELWSSYVIRAEVLAGMRDEEAPRTHQLLQAIRWAGVDLAESDAAGELGQRHNRANAGIDTPDLLLAELAQRLDAELVTMNVKHFPMFPGLKRPYSY
jgi:predicted nucleic acid-binding protein